MPKLSRFIKIIILFLVIVSIFLLVSPHYLRNSLIYWFANINDYKIFENSIVKANEADEWEISKDYNKYTLPSEDRIYLESHKTVAFLVIQNKKIIYEEYWDGYNEQSYSNVFSVTKSIVGLLIGIAIDEGKIKSIDDPIGKYITEFTDDERSNITIKNLLTMSSGLDWNETYSNPFSITTKAYYGKHLREITTNQHIIEPQGVRFRYQSGNTQLLAFIIETATGKTVADYASEKLWIPLGAKNNAIWSLDKKNGDEKAFCCFNTNIRDIARLGQLVLNKGKWNNHQIVSENYITSSTTAASYLLNEKKKEKLNFYGYHWWILPHKNTNIPYMRGLLGQYVYSMPEKNAVVVRFGKSKDKIKKGQITMDIPQYVDIAVKMLK